MDGLCPFDRLSGSPGPSQRPSPTLSNRLRGLLPDSTEAEPSQFPQVVSRPNPEARYRDSPESVRLPIPYCRELIWLTIQEGESNPLE